MEDACSVTITGEGIEVGGASLLSADTVSRFLHTVALTRAVVKSTFVESKTSPSPKRFESESSPSPKRFESESNPSPKRFESKSKSK